MKRKHLGSLFYKEIMDIHYNGQILFLLFIPLSGLIALYFQNRPTSWTFIVIFTLMILPIYTQANMVVEEKEQQTWRILKQRGVSLYSIVYVKATLTYIMTLIVLWITLWFSHLSFFSVLLVCLYITPTIIIMLSIGTIIATFSKNTIEVSFWGAPIVIFFIALEIIHRVLSKNEWDLIQDLYPNQVFYNGLTLIPNNPLAAFSFPFFYFLLLSIACSFLAIFVLKKRKHTF